MSLSMCENCGELFTIDPYNMAGEFTEQGFMCHECLQKLSENDYLASREEERYTQWCSEQMDIADELL